MNEPNVLLKPIVVDNNTIQRVSSNKLLGVFVDGDLKWN